MADYLDPIFVPADPDVVKVVRCKDCKHSYDDIIYVNGVATVYSARIAEARLCPLIKRPVGTIWQNGGTGGRTMTREQYLDNHAATEGAEEETTVTRCPICGSDECTVIYVQDGEPIGCDACLDTQIRCPHCGSEAWDELIWKDGKPIGCDRCVREVERWEWCG